MRSSIAVCGALLTALLLGACGGGGDDGPTAEEEVKQAAVRAIESNDPDQLCHKLLGKPYIARVYDGSVAKCVKAADDDETDAGKAKATKPKVNEDETKATVTVAVSGGSLDGADGQLEMVKEGTWKVDDYGDDLVRSTFIAAIKTSDEGLVSTPEMRACFIRQVARMPIALIRHLTYASSADEEKEVEGKLLKMAGECPESALAEYGAEEFTKGLVNNGTHEPGYVKCIHEELRSLLELTGITAELLGENPDFAAVAALEGITEGAKENCGG
jgi:hypothetical protein